MKTSIGKYMILSVIIILILFLGYYRDFIFKGINAILQAKDLQASYTPAVSLQFLQHYSYPSLLKIKWGLTLLFSLTYLGIALYSVHLIFRNPKFNRITIATYLVVGLISGLFMATGVVFQGVSDKMYEFSRYLMGMAQSPIILMILIPAFKLSLQEHNNIPN